MFWWKGRDARLRALETTVEQLSNRIDELDQLHRDLNDLPVQWEDWLHKIRNVLSRLNRRAEREDVPPPEPAMNPAAAKLLGIIR